MCHFANAEQTLLLYDADEVPARLHVGPGPARGRTCRFRSSSRLSGGGGGGVEGKSMWGGRSPASGSWDSALGSGYITHRIY